MNSQIDKRKIIVYTAGPYSGNVSKNIDIASYYARKLWRAGYTVVCPHKNSAYYDNIIPYEEFLKGYLILLERCGNALFLLPNWKKSSGTLEEIKVADKNNIPKFRHNERGWDKKMEDYFANKAIDSR